MFTGVQNVASVNEILGAPVQIFHVQVRDFSSNAPLILFNSSSRALVMKKMIIHVQ